MKLQKSSEVKYTREKNKVEISGDAKDVKRQIWFDLISSRVIQIALIILFILILKSSGADQSVFMYWPKKTVSISLIMFCYC